MMFGPAELSEWVVGVEATDGELVQHGTVSLGLAGSHQSGSGQCAGAAALLCPAHPALTRPARGAQPGTRNMLAASQPAQLGAGHCQIVQQQQILSEDNPQHFHQLYLLSSTWLTNSDSHQRLISRSIVCSNGDCLDDCSWKHWHDQEKLRRMILSRKYHQTEKYFCRNYFLRNQFNALYENYVVQRKLRNISS